MKIAIVILNWNGAELLKRFVPSVLENSAGKDVWVIDNASTDGSKTILSQQFPTVKQVRLNQNHGFAGGYNLGLAHIDADVFCLLNSDVEVTQNWIGPIIDVFEKRPEVAIIQPKIKDLKRKEYFEYAGAAGGFIDLFGYPFCRGRMFQSIEKDLGQYDDHKDIFWATGACMFIRSEVFKMLGGFDQDYFAHQEEIDLCWRAKNHGFGVRYVGTSTVYHLGGSTLSNMNPKKTFLNFRNSLFSLVKNLPLKKALPLIFVRLALDGIAAIYFAVQFRLLHTWAVFRAHLSFYYHFNKMYRKREKINFVAKHHLVKSILWSYYVYGKRRFGKLIKD